MWDLKKIRIEQHLLPIAEKAIASLNAIQREHFFLLHFAFRRVRGVQTSHILFVTAATHWRPPKNRLIAIVTSPPYSFLLPSAISKDFFDTAAYVGLTTVEDYVVLYDFVRLQYGVTIKKCSPKRLKSSDDGKNYGIPENLYPEILDDGEISTWWQPWGGILYRLKQNRDISILERQDVTKGVGFFFKLPFYVYR